jgi:hypothetical protein
VSSRASWQKKELELGLILTTLVTGASASAREIAIAQALAPGVASAIILEGLADGTSRLDDRDQGGAGCVLVRIAPGCLCCTGNLVLRVTLNRILRQRPAQLFIGLANGAHIEQLRLWLSQAPYDQWLTLQADIAAAQVGRSDT